MIACLRFISLLLVMLTLRAEARMNTATASPSTTSYERGILSVHVGYGMDESKLTNSDNTDAAFQGDGLILNLDIRVGGGGPGEVRLFGLGKQIESTNRASSDVKLETDVYAGGLKVFATDWLYFGGGLGVTHQTIDSPDASVSLSNTYYFAQTGLEFHLFSSFYVHLAGMAQVNPIKRADSMQTHSFSEGVGGYLFLTFSPPNVSVTNVFK